MSQATNTALQIARDAAFATKVYDEVGEYRTSQQFTKGDLPYGVDLYARVRHIGDPVAGDSNWSNPTKFRVIIPANVIGVCMDNSTTKGVFYWIDALGNRVSSFDWQSHPTYAGISMVTQDASRAPVTLTKFPLFYIKTAASGPVGTFANGMKCWWMSDLQEPGFRPAAAFKRTTSTDADGNYVIAPFCYMGTFLGHTQTAGGKTVIGSSRGQTVAASQTKSTFKTWITNRNDAAAGQTGYRMFDIWDLSVLRLLLLIAKANSDTQSAWGDNSAGTAYPKTGSTNARAVFQGTHTNPIVSIEDLWRCYWYHADLITVNSGVVSLVSPMNLSSALSFGSATASRYTQPTSSGWIRDVLDCPFTIGNDTHDLMELFLPKTVVSSENQATFSDYHRGSAYSFGHSHFYWPDAQDGVGTNTGPGIALVGTPHTTAGTLTVTMSGAFMSTCDTTPRTTRTYAGSRLSKN